ncbi:CYTH domain-containing protein [Pallidibacillus pasinlerensis]|uniref:CYTH domain-containing protein n=1 Tax=Pallidibacillus pasinlerensis TaxID=2703818 RepID=A0ABX0ABS6_9BACI|nr:CYTH domain-containing protein [Pallidibacillus pasinlerensis]NCU18895.1 CYTH domain-containing protein [Pallidibacillus pasinlerensis]
MSEQLEIEFKNIVTEEEFIKLLDYFSITKEDFFSQENEYFDTEDFALKKLGCALRIRQKNGKYEFTLKETKEIGLLETNEQISEEARKKLIEENLFPEGKIAEKLRKLNISLEKVKYFGSLKTERKELPHYDGILVLDKSYYLNIVDFELEYEVEDYETGKQHFINLLQTLQIPQRKTLNKIQRFYNRKMELANREK